MTLRYMIYDNVLKSFSPMYIRESDEEAMNKMHENCSTTRHTFVPNSLECNCTQYQDYRKIMRGEVR